MTSSASPLQPVIAKCQAELAGLYAEVQAEHAKHVLRWQDEAPMLESFITALTSTRQILQRESKQLTAELTNLKAFLDKKSAEEAAQQDPTLAGDDVAHLRAQLSDLESKVVDLDQQLHELVTLLSGDAGVRPEERSIYETKLVVLQDTRRLLHSEASAVAAELKRRENAAKLESDKHSAAQLGVSDLARLTEQLTAAESKLDRAKVDSYFPKIKGFKFSGGSNGVYFACKDLHLCEVSGAFSLALEAVPPQQQQAGSADQQQAGETRLKITLSGISSSSNSQAFRQQQAAHDQQQQAKAAARSKSLKCMQPQAPPVSSNSSIPQQQPQQSGSTASCVAADSTAQFALQPEAALSNSAAGAASGYQVPNSGNRRGAAVQKFLERLSDKKGRLSQAIKTSGDHNMLQVKPEVAEAMRSGFSRIAGAFGDKAAAFGDRVSQEAQQHLPHTQSGTEQDLSGLVGGAIKPNVGELQSAPPAGGDTAMSSAVAAEQQSAFLADSSGPPASSTTASKSTGASSSTSSNTTRAVDTSQASSNSSSFAPAELGTGSISSKHMSLESLGSPVTASQSGSVNFYAGSSSAPHSGSRGPGCDQPDGHVKSRLGNRMDSMKGRLGGLLADSKQKLQGSKFVLDSREKAKHLLADSKHLLEEGKTGFKAKLSNISSKLEEHLQHPPNLQQQQWPPPPPQQQQQAMHIMQAPAHPRVVCTADSAAAEAAAASQQYQSALAESNVAKTNQQQQPQAAGRGELSTANAEADDQASAACQEPSDGRCVGDQNEGAATVAATRCTDAGSQLAVTPATNAEASERPGTNNSHGAPAPEPADPAPLDVGAVDLEQVPACSAATDSPTAGAAPSCGSTSGAVDKQLLDEALPGDGDGGSGGLLRGGSGVAGGKGSSGRRGVVVMLVVEGLEVIGEKGTKVPNIRAAQLGLEVESCLSASLTYSPVMGWQNAGLTFEVISLERVVQGSNLPLPKTLIKSLLNMVLPSVFTKLLLTSLPHELGKFIQDSAAAAAAAVPAANSNSSSGSTGSKLGLDGSGAGVLLSGEISVSGLPAACLSANMTRTSDDLPVGRLDIKDFAQELRTAQKARALLNLSEPRYAKALALLFNPGPYSLLPGGSGLSLASSQANQVSAAAAPSSSGSSGSGGSVLAAGPSNNMAALGSMLSITLNDLCRFYVEYADSPVWESICRAWQTAVDAVCEQLAQQEGLMTTNGILLGVNGSSACRGGAASFDFTQLMCGRVARLMKKPVRVSCGLRQLSVGLDVGAGLAAARDYCERVAREFAENAKGEDALLLLQRPLSMQLELLDLWHGVLAAQLTTFAQQFRGAAGRVLLAADKNSFSVAAEGCSYEGPLRLKVPLPLMADLAAGACSWDVTLPDPRGNTPSFSTRLRFVSAALAKAAFGTSDEEQELLRDAAALAAAAAAEQRGQAADTPLTQAAELAALIAVWSQVGQQQPAAATSSNNDHAADLLQRRNSSSVHNVSSAASIDSAQRTKAAAALPGSEPAGLLDSANIGRVLLSRLSLSLVLDEKRLKELLAGGIKDASLVGGLLGCFGQLFTATVAPGWQQQQQQQQRASDQDSPANGSGSTVNSAEQPSAMLTVKNNDVTRVKLELESASFMSSIPPRVMVRLLHILALALVLKFMSSSSKRLGYLNKVFNHIAEYLGRDCLDLLMCVDVAATATEAGDLQVMLKGVAPTAGESSSSSACASGHHENNTGTTSWPVYVINDVNLLTVLDTVKLILDYSS